MPDTLGCGQSLCAGQSLTSGNGVYTLTMQSDGELVLRRSGVAIWVESCSPGSCLVMQVNGDLVLRGADGHVCWDTGTEPCPGATAVVQNNGDFVVKAPNGTILWDTGTETLAFVLLAADQARDAVEVAGRELLAAQERLLDHIRRKRSATRGRKSRAH